MAKKKKQNPLSAEPKKQAAPADAIAESASAEIEETADAVVEEIGDAAEKAEETLAEAAEQLTDTAEDITDEIEEEAEDIADELEDAADETEEAAEAVTGDDDDDDSDSDGKKAKTDAPKKAPKRERTPEEEKERALNKVNRRKKLKYGTLATVITAVVLASVVIGNVIVNVLDNRYNWNIDLTSSGLYEIDAQTVSYLNKINSDIQIAVMSDEQNFDNDPKLKVVEETLNRFKAESNGHISVEYIDMTKHPEAVSRYSQGYDGDFSAYDTVVKCGDLVRVVGIDSMIKTDQTPNYMTMSYDYSYTFIGEQSLISAIMGVTDLNPIKVGIISKTAGQPIYYDYNSPAFQGVKTTTIDVDGMLQLFEKNNYIVTELDLASDSFTADEYDLVVLCAPYNDLSEAQIKKLSDYLYNNGQYNADLIYFGSFFQQETPNLDAFLELWGLKIGNAVVMESNTAAAQVVPSIIYQQISDVPVAAVSSNDLNSSVTASKLPVVVPFSRPITMLFTDPNNGRETQALLTTPNTSYLRPLDIPAEEFNEANAEKGSYALAVIADNEVIVDNSAHTSRIVAFGTPWILDPYIVESKSYANADYFISVMNQMTGKEGVLTIAEKSLDTTSVSITTAQAKAIRTVTVIVLPLLVAVIGFVVYIRRKNL